MEIPSWAFASAGKALTGSVSEMEQTIIPVPVPVPAFKIQEPAIYTFYDEIINIINDMLPERNAILEMLIELYT